MTWWPDYALIGALVLGAVSLIGESIDALEQEAEHNMIWRGRHEWMYAKPKADAAALRAILEGA